MTAVTGPASIGIVTTPSAARHPRLRTIARRWRHRGLTVEAMALLTVTGALQKWVPMTKWSPLLGAHGPVPEAWHGSTVVRLPARAATAEERRVAVAIRSGAARLPWHATCLAEATTGQVLLRQLRQSGVVVIGLRVTEAPPWDAHAWLLGRAGALTGGPAARGFTATTVFEVPGGLQAQDVDVVSSLTPAA